LNRNRTLFGVLIEMRGARGEEFAAHPHREMFTKLNANSVP
jgi:hypothetical protein